MDVVYEGGDVSLKHHPLCNEDGTHAYFKVICIVQLYWRTAMSGIRSMCYFSLPCKIYVAVTKLVFRLGLKLDHSYKSSPNGTKTCHV